MRTVRIALILAAVTAVSVTGATSASAQQAGATQDADIVDTAVAAGSFDTLAKLLQRARLVDTLKGEGPFTVFAPTDAAFSKVPKNKLNALLRNRRKLRRVLLYHVAAGQLEAADVVQRWSIRTLNGRKVRVRVTDSNVFLNRARVVTPDVMASNGVIHVIDRVLIPPAG
jgi:uncharacterized surface protein with fasciclin (FAS1) repeats